MGLPKYSFQKFLFVESGDHLIVDYSQLFFLNMKEKTGVKKQSE